mmetsp:Transcript_31527/g.94021  ORF Transcript_31527/g.94021 Transcript_31527/m.94021 type:complete len:349 (-) Transcript_31527:1842-2888(-)
MARNAALLRRLSRVLSRAGADAAGARSASAVATPSLSEGLQRRVAPDGAAGAGAQLAAQGALQVASPAAPAVRDGSHGGASADGAPPAAAAAALLGQARGTWRVPVSATQQVLAGGCAASALALAPALASAGLRTGRGLGSLRGLVASGNGPRPAHAMPAGVRGVKTQPTPNPQSLMFLPGHKVLEGGSRSFGGAGAASGSPLAERLFAIEGVASVFLGSDFVTVTKQEDAAWGPLKAAVADAISAHFASGAPAVHPDGSEDGNDEDQEEDEVRLKSQRQDCGMEVRLQLEELVDYLKPHRLVPKPKSLQPNPKALNHTQTLNLKAYAQHLTSLDEIMKKSELLICYV